MYNQKPTWASYQNYSEAELPGDDKAESSNADSYAQSFSFTDLTDTAPVEINEEFADLVQTLGEESFPDKEGVRYVAEHVVEADGIRYAEIVPDADTGYSKYVFVINDGNRIVACYCFEDGAYSLLFT